MDDLSYKGQRLFEPLFDPFVNIPFAKADSLSEEINSTYYRRKEIRGHFVFRRGWLSNHKFHILPTCKTCSSQSKIPHVSSSMVPTRSQDLLVCITSTYSSLSVALDP